jgi:hypothetical protein
VEHENGSDDNGENGGDNGENGGDDGDEEDGDNGDEEDGDDDAGSGSDKEPICFPPTLPNPPTPMFFFPTPSAPQDSSFTIKINIMSREKTIEVSVDPLDSIGSVKAQIQGKEGINKKHMRLLFRGLDLLNDETLQAYDIKQDDCLDLVPRGCGGGKRGAEWRGRRGKRLRGRLGAGRGAEERRAGTGSWGDV